MPRRERCIVPGVPCHVTQRGVDRRETFSADADRETYLQLIRLNLTDSGARVLGWCLMTNHVHLVVMPEREDSLAVLLRRSTGRYAQYYNARYGRSGTCGRTGNFACAVGTGASVAALQYVERNPVRAWVGGLAGAYRWSSGVAHMEGRDPQGLVDRDWWQRRDEGVAAGPCGPEMSGPRPRAMPLRGVHLR